MFIDKIPRRTSRTQFKHFKNTQGNKVQWGRTSRNNTVQTGTADINIFSYGILNNDI